VTYKKVFEIEYHPRYKKALTHILRSYADILKSLSKGKE